MNIGKKDNLMIFNKMEKHMRKIISRFIILFTLLSCPCFYGAAVMSIENITSPNASLTTEDIIELSIVVDNVSNNNLDLSPLKANFEIINQTQQVYHSIINGKSSSKIKWLISLQAKTTGILTIPGIKVGGQITNQLPIEIKSPNIDPNKPQEIFINIETDNQELYVKAPLSILVNIYVSTNITARNLQLDLPENDNYKLYKISENNKQVFYKNKEYYLYQVKYLAFYNIPGKLKLPKFNLSGLKLKNNSRYNDVFSLYQQQWQPFNRSSHELEINILDKPVSFTQNNWFAADNVTIKQTWSSSENSIKLGDALQRTIIITGQNVPAEYLPILENPEANNINNNNYKIYVDKPELNNNTDNNMLTSTSIQRITYIPTNDGTLNLANKTISWWHNKTKTKIDAIIEGKNFHIINTNNNLNNNVPTEKNISSNASYQTIAPKIEAKIPKLSKISTAINYAHNKIDLKLFYFLCSIIFVLLTISFILAYKLKQYKKLISNKLNSHLIDKINTDLKTSNKQLEDELNKQIKILKTYAINQDAHHVYKTINSITKIIYPKDLGSTITLRKILSEHSKIAFDALMEAIYSPHKANWDNIEFINIFIPELEQRIKNFIEKKSSKHKFNKSYNLPELYPK